MVDLFSRIGEDFGHKVGSGCSEPGGLGFDTLMKYDDSDDMNGHNGNNPLLVGSPLQSYGFQSPPLLTDQGMESDSSDTSAGSYSSNQGFGDDFSDLMPSVSPMASNPPPPFPNISAHSPGMHGHSANVMGGAHGQPAPPPLAPMNQRFQEGSFYPQPKAQAAPGRKIVRGRRGGQVVTLDDAKKEIRKRKLARKAELARQSRKRKKERLEELEVEVVKLRQQIGSLRKKHRSELASVMSQQPPGGIPGPPPVGPVGGHDDGSGRDIAPPPPGAVGPMFCGSIRADAEVNTSLQLIIDAVEKTDSQKVSSHKLTKLINGFVASLEKVDGIAKKHAEELASSSDVPLPIRFLQWAMSQSDVFFADQGGLFTGVFDDQIGFSAKQKSTLMGMREQMKKQRSIHREVLQHGVKFSQLLKLMHEVSAENFKKIRSIFTERQLAQFFVWVNNNKLCVHMITNKN